LTTTFWLSSKAAQRSRIVTTGDVISWVIVGFAFVWGFDVLHTWDAIDAWLDRRGLIRRRA
jgi:hypothetical protein